MPKAFVGFDTMIPFVTCLKEYNDWEIHCIFLNMSQYSHLERIPVYEKILKESANIYILKPGSLMGSVYNIVNIFIRLLFSLKPRIITVGGQTAKGKIRKLIKFISRIKGQYYVLPNYNAPMPMEFFNNYYMKALCDANLRNILGKKPGKFDAYIDKRLVGELLLQSEYEDERADLFGFPEQRKYLGYYKLHKPWLDKVVNNNYFQNKRLQEASECVFIATKKSGKYFFNSDTDYLELLNDSIRSVRKLYPDTLIVLKPKPFQTIEVNDWIPDYVDSLNDDQVIVDSTPLTFTAHKAILAIFNIASTAYFDFVVQDVPCIEHARYGENYCWVNPHGSYMKNYGVVKTSTEDELVKAISMVKSQTFPIFGQKNIVNDIGHTNAIDGFEKL